MDDDQLNENKGEETEVEVESEKRKRATAKKRTPSKKLKRAAAKNATKKSAATPKSEIGISSPYPRHTIDKALRIPKAILEQNAGKESTEDEAAKFIGLSTSNGPFRTEISSSIKYGLLERPKSRYVKPTELAKQILRPKSVDDEVKGLQEELSMLQSLEKYIDIIGVKIFPTDSSSKMRCLTFSKFPRLIFQNLLLSLMNRYSRPSLLKNWVINFV